MIKINLNLLLLKNLTNYKIRPVLKYKKNLIILLYSVQTIRESPEMTYPLFFLD